MYGTQAVKLHGRTLQQFENDVKMYGTQAINISYLSYDRFENDVKMYGTQATIAPPSPKSSLRMM